MKRFLVSIGPRANPRLQFEAMARSSVEVTEQHLCLARMGERVEVRAL